MSPNKNIEKKTENKEGWQRKQKRLLLLTCLAWENNRHFATNGFPAKWRLRNEQRNSIPDDLPILRSGHWFWLVRDFLHPIRSVTQLWAVARLEYGISVLVFQTSFRGKPCHCWRRRKMFAVFSGYIIPFFCNSIIVYFIFLTYNNNINFYIH